MVWALMDLLFTKGEMQTCNYRGGASKNTKGARKKAFDTAKIDAIRCTYYTNFVIYCLKNY